MALLQNLDINNNIIHVATFGKDRDRRALTGYEENLFSYYKLWQIDCLVV